MLKAVRFIYVLVFHSGILLHYLCSTWGCSVLQQCSQCHPAALVQGQNHAHTARRKRELLFQLAITFFPHSPRQILSHNSVHLKPLWFISARRQKMHLINSLGYQTHFVPYARSSLRYKEAAGAAPALSCTMWWWWQKSWLQSRTWGTQQYPWLDLEPLLQHALYCGGSSSMWWGLAVMITGKAVRWRLELC